MKEFIITLNTNDSPNRRLHPLVDDFFTDSNGDGFHTFSHYYLWLLTKQDYVKRFGLETIKGLYPELNVVLDNGLVQNLYRSLHNTFYMRLTSYGIKPEGATFVVDDTSPRWFKDFINQFNTNK